MTHPAPEPLEPDDAYLEEYEAWRDLRDVLEERNREYWAENADENPE